MKLSSPGNTALLFSVLPFFAAGAQAVAWREATRLPSPRSGAAVFALGGVLYVMGGQNQTRFIAATQSFDTATRRWTRHAPLRLGRAFSATNAAMLGGTMYVVAGNPRGYCTNANDAFDAAAAQWRLLRGAPVARCHAATVAADGRILVFGGWNTSSTVRYLPVDAYDPRSNAWARETTLPRPRGAMAAGVIGRTIYLAGGWTPDAPVSASMDTYQLDARRWSPGPALHVPRGAPASVVFGGRLYVMGGIAAAGDHTEFTASVESFDPRTNTWRAEPPLPFPLAYASAAVIGNTIYVVGGAREDGTILSSVFALTLGTP